MDRRSSCASLRCADAEGRSGTTFYFTLPISQERALLSGKGRGALLTSSGAPRSASAKGEASAPAPCSSASLPKIMYAVCGRRMPACLTPLGPGPGGGGHPAEESAGAGTPAGVRRRR